jgi:hypothetical protein
MMYLVGGLLARQYYDDGFDRILAISHVYSSTVSLQMRRCALTNEYLTASDVANKTRDNATAY